MFYVRMCMFHLKKSNWKFSIFKKKSSEPEMGACHAFSLSSMSALPNRKKVQATNVMFLNFLVTTLKKIKVKEKR